MVLHKKVLSRIRCRRHRSQFSSETVLQIPEAGQLIRQRIESGDPLMVSRFSTCEIDVLNIFRQRSRSPLAKKLGWLLDGIPAQYTEPIRFRAHNNAGIFPATDKGLDEFSRITFDACSRIDILGVWGSPLHQEETLWKERCPNAGLVALPSIEPYYDPAPWSAALTGKRVLVVHPFEASIRQQYAKRGQLFPSTEILPEFDLKTLRAVQSNAGGETACDSWAGALNFMQEQISAMDFDVALIGAGAYGLPLAAHVKGLGKQAVHMGGALQILFGIKGGRWDDNPAINQFYNEHWIRPLPEETPQDSGKVEEGCYW